MDQPTIDYRADAARGAGWLDSVAPGWADLVDLDVLDLSSTTACVLGQVFAEQARDKPCPCGFAGCAVLCNGYEYGCDLLEVGEGSPVDYPDGPWTLAEWCGFSARGWDISADQWAALKAAWVEIVTVRRTASALVVS